MSCVYKYISGHLTSSVDPKRWDGPIYWTV